VAGVLLGLNRPPLGYFAGRLDEVRVWSSAKSAEAVQAGMLDTLPSDAERGGLVHVPSLELYLPNNQVSCGEAENLCVNGMQKWMVGDDGRLQLMGFAAQCLALSSPVVALGLPMQSTLCVAADYMRWLPLLESDSLATPHLLRTGASSFPLVCLSGSRERPYAGKVLFLVECVLSDQDDDGNFVDRRHMQWRLLESGEYRHELSGLCMTASFGNGGPVFLANCLVVTDDVLLQGVAIDYTPFRRFGSFVGGTRFEVSLAPIDRAPAFTLFNGQAVKSSLQRVFVQVGRAVSFVLQARDPNLSDTVSIEVFGNIPSDAIISPSVTEQIATRVFSWTPSSSNLLYNPTDIYCQVIDSPANPLNPNSVAKSSASSELQVQMVVLLPPEWATSAPPAGAVFEARVGATLPVAMVAMDRNSGDAIQIEFGQNCHASALPPLPLAQVTLGPNVPAPGPPPFPNPVTRTIFFSPLPAHSNTSFCACFVAKSAGADSPIRCIVIRVLEFSASFIEDGGVGAVLPRLHPSPGDSLQQLSDVSGNITANAVQLLQGNVVNWTVGVSVSGASGFTLRSSRIIHVPAAGYLEVQSSAFPDLTTFLLEPPALNVSSDDVIESSNITSSGAVASSVVALQAVWRVRRGQPGTYIICFVLNIPIAYGPLYQQEGCARFSFRTLIATDSFAQMLFIFSFALRCSSSRGGHVVSNRLFTRAIVRRHAAREHAPPGQARPSVAGRCCGYIRRSPHRGAVLHRRASRCHARDAATIEVRNVTSARMRVTQCIL
jgi:hypothetical protein